VAFLSRGRALLVAPMEDLRHLVVRVRARCDGTPPAGSTLGTVLHEQRMGGNWQVILREPDRGALERLRWAPGISGYEETAPGLEEVYCALLGRKDGSP
jgi:hypothetical protein